MRCWITQKFDSFANFSPIFKKTLVSKNDNGDLMKTYAEEEAILSQPRKMLIPSFTLHNSTLITPLFSFLSWIRSCGLVCTKIHCILEYTPKKCFNSFVQSAVGAGRQKAMIPSQMSLQSQWSCQLTVPMVIKLWIAADTLWRHT